MEADEEEVRLDFVNTGFQWPQPDGLGSAITITYSYSNLLDGQLRGVSKNQARNAVEEAFAIWASVAPLHFVEVEDKGPAPSRSDGSYSTNGRPQIRIGHHEIDGANGGVLAHAFLPFSQSDGIAGDLHVDRAEDWSESNGGFFLEMVLHEIGHTLGLDHEAFEEAIMNAIIKGRFTELGSGKLFPDDIAGIREIYGQGVGSVTPLADSEEPDNPDEPGEPDEPDEPSDAAGVVAEFDGETLIISGDGDANSVLLLSAPGVIVVVGLEGSTVNGQSWDYFAVGLEKNINCDLGDGADWLWLVRLRAGVVECNLGAGEDALVVLFSSIESLYADGGSDDDLLFRLFARIRTVSDVAFESKFGF